jgi:tRNA threonylcarbamoyl adenosine modification protein YeaZ
MLTLVVERSSRRPGWALFRDEHCLLETVADEEPSRSPDWSVRLDRALAEAGMSLAGIHRFAAGIGPGSFSGTRATIAALQGMALPDGRALLGVSSVAALAFARLNASAQAGDHAPVTVIGDARRNRLWIATYALDPVHNRLTALFDGAFRPPTHDAADFSLVTWETLPAALPKNSRVLSPDWDRIGERLRACLPPERLVAETCLPTAADVGRLVLSDPTAARREPTPIYLHPAVEVRA